MKVFTYIKILSSVFFSLIISTGCHGQGLPKLQSKALNEVSGLAVSPKEMIFLHNDSGDSSRFFAIDAKGKLISTLYFKGDLAISPLGVADCEDMAFGPGAKKGKNYIYLGDIGDNRASRPYLSVYRFAEPERLSGVMQLDVEVLHFKYPNGPQDAETMMVDPLLKELIVVSKRQDTVGIYATSLSFKSGDTVILRKQGGLFLNGKSPAKQVVSGDISKDGKAVLLKTYAGVYYWKRQGSEPLAKTLHRKPVELPYVLEPQGEAIGFTADGKGYHCISEGEHAVIYRYALPGVPRK